MIQQFLAEQSAGVEINQETLVSVLTEFARVLGYAGPQKLPMHLKPAQVSLVTSMTVGTLATKRCTGMGSPPYTKIGGMVVYPTVPLAEWLIQRTVMDSSGRK
ncbi:MAG: hypothetical protein R3F53_18270 [Gammaproteobacteria bacterium]